MFFSSACFLSEHKSPYSVATYTASLIGLLFCLKYTLIDTCLSLFFLLSENQYTVLPSFLGA
jgi:hypothetical protein